MKLSGKLIYSSVVAALAGLLFGFDTVVISGAEKTIQSVWGLDNWLHGLAMSAALWGMVVGSLVGGVPTDRIGRKWTLIGIGALYFVSAVWSALATDVYSFMIARVIGGVGVGISTVAAPLYISEIAPPAARGRLAGMFQFNIVFGILIAYVSNFLLSETGVTAWRWMLGVEAFPALVYTLLALGVPESPRWLIAKRGDREAGERVLALINQGAPPEEITTLADEIASASEADEDPAAEGVSFWTSRLRVPLMLAFFVAFFNQLSGINAILYFAPRIFQLAGLGESAALWNSVGIGVTNLVFTFIGLYLIDKLGRRTLLYIGSFGYIVALGVCSWAFFAYAPTFSVANAAITLDKAVAGLEKAEALEVKHEEDIVKLTANVASARESLVEATAAERYAGEPVELPADASRIQLKAVAQDTIAAAGEKAGAGGTMVLVCILVFIAAHAVGQGAVIWVLISEIFPNRHRAMGQALGSFTHWIFAAMLTLVFPWMIGTFPPGYVFGFFCFMMVLQLVWVATTVPETRGVPLEEMQKKLGAN